MSVAVDRRRSRLPTVIMISRAARARGPNGIEI